MGVETSTPVASILANLVSSPGNCHCLTLLFHSIACLSANFTITLISAGFVAVLIIPIGAGLLVALALGFFISSYGQGKDVEIDGEGRK